MPAQQQAHAVTTSTGASGAPPWWLPAEIAADASAREPLKYVEVASPRAAAGSKSSALLQFLTGPEGSKARELVEPAATTLIVCGTRGMGALASLVVGSTAQAILAASLAPCLVIRSCVAETFGPPPPVATPPPPPRVVVIAVDASPSGAALCRWAAASVVRPGDTVRLVHAESAIAAAASAKKKGEEGKDEGAGGGEAARRAAFVADAKAALDEALRSPDLAGVAVAEPEVLHQVGGPGVGATLLKAVGGGASAAASAAAAMLCAFLDKQQPSLLVVGTRPAPGSRTTPGRFAAHCCRSAPCPVLVASGPLLAELTDHPAGGEGLKRYYA